VSTVPAPPASPSSPTDPSSGAGGPPSPGGPAVGDLPRWVRPALLANLVAQIAIVVTGGLVRVTGSGLGCPTWPRCVGGSFTPVAHQAESYHKYIEFGNRTLTSVLVATSVAALVATFAVRRRRDTGARFLVLGLSPFVLVLAQAILGGITVLVGLSPATVAAHFLGSAALIVVSALLYLAIGEPVVASDRRELRWITAGVAVLAAVVLVLGTVVTGSGPHSGDADTPARFGFDPRDVAWLHADAVWLFVGLVVALVLVARLTGADAALRRRAGWLLVVTLGQGVIGYVQYATHLPRPLVVLHMLGAALLTLAVTAVAAGVVGTRKLTGAGPPTESLVELP
jgi:cytochrome c oxidase assembly protein subunit 15